MLRVRQEERERNDDSNRFRNSFCSGPNNYSPSLVEGCSLKKFCKKRRVFLSLSLPDEGNRRRTKEANNRREKQVRVFPSLVSLPPPVSFPALDPCSHRSPGPNHDDDCVGKAFLSPEQLFVFQEDRNVSGQEDRERETERDANVRATSASLFCVCHAYSRKAFASCNSSTVSFKICFLLDFPFLGKEM